MYGVQHLLIHMKINKTSQLHPRFFVVVCLCMHIKMAARTALGWQPSLALADEIAQDIVMNPTGALGGMPVFASVHHDTAFNIVSSRLLQSDSIGTTQLNTQAVHTTNLTVDDFAQFNGPVTVQSTTNLIGALTVPSAPVTLGGQFTSNGNATFQTLTAEQEIQFNGSLCTIATTSTDVTGTLDIDGTYVGLGSVPQLANGTVPNDNNPAANMPQSIQLAINLAVGAGNVFAAPTTRSWYQNVRVQTNANGFNYYSYYFPLSVVQALRLSINSAVFCNVQNVGVVPIESPSDYGMGVCDGYTWTPAARITDNPDAPNKPAAGSLMLTLHIYILSEATTALVGFNAVSVRIIG